LRFRVALVTVGPVDPQTWTYEDLKTFLLLYCANADLDETPDELRMLSRDVSPERLEELTDFFDGNSDYDNLQAIVSLKPKYFADPPAVERLVADMEALFRVDGDYSYIEKVILGAVRRIL